MTKAAEKARKKFLKKLDRLLLRDMEKQALDILVWGPSISSGTPVAKKRLEIRDELIQRGHNAMFSEDIPLTTAAAYLSEKTKELRQAQLVHMIIVLIEGAPGALAEVHDFSNEPALADKFYVMAPRSYEKGYSGRGTLALLSDGHAGVYWYEPGELTSCNVKTKALERINARKQLLMNHPSLR